MRAAEEAAGTFSKSISPDECMTVLSPLINESLYPVNLAAIKMLTKVCDATSTLLVKSLFLLFKFTLNTIIAVVFHVFFASLIIHTSCMWKKRKLI